MHCLNSQIFKNEISTFSKENITINFEYCDFLRAVKLKLTLFILVAGQVNRNFSLVLNEM